LDTAVDFARAALLLSGGISFDRSDAREEVQQEWISAFNVGRVSVRNRDCVAFVGECHSGRTDQRNRS
jgi:hypothetical protein